MTPEFCNEVSARLNELLAVKRQAPMTKWSRVTGDITLHPDGHITADRCNIDHLFAAAGEKAVLQIAMGNDVDRSLLDRYLRAGL